MLTALTLGLARLLGSGTWLLDAASVLVGVVIVVAAVLVNQRLALRRTTPAASGMFLGPCDYELDRAGLERRRADSQLFCTWRAVIDVTRTGTHVFAWTDRFAGFVIPGRDLPGGLTPEALAEASRSTTPASAGASS